MPAAQKIPAAMLVTHNFLRFCSCRGAKPFHVVKMLFVHLFSSVLLSFSLAELELGGTGTAGLDSTELVEVQAGYIIFVKYLRKFPFCAAKIHFSAENFLP